MPQIDVRRLNFMACAATSMLVLWASLTFSIALTEIAFVCALIFWAGWHFRHPKETGTVFSTNGKGVGFPRIDGSVWLPLVLFFAFVVLSFFTSEYPRQSLRGLYKIAKPLLAFLMASELFSKSEYQKRFDLVFLATFLLLTIDCSIQYAFGKDLFRGFTAEYASSGIRIVGPFGNFAKMATYLVLVIPVFIMRFWNDFRQAGHRKSALYSLALSVGALVLLYLTRCRGAVVALIFALGFLSIYKRWFKALGIALLLCLALLAGAPRHLLIHQNAQGKEQSLGERYYLWRRAIDVIVAKPFLGTGINTYDKAHAKYDTLRQKKYITLEGTGIFVRQNADGSISLLDNGKVWTSDTKQNEIQIRDKKYFIHKDSAGKYYIWNDFIAQGYYAHNGYLQLAAEIGLPGTFFFLLFCFMFFRWALRNLRKVRNTPGEYECLGITTGLLAFLIYAAADNNLQSPPSLMFFWFSAGILAAREGSLFKNDVKTSNA